MVNRNQILCLLFVAGSAFADVRYTMKCEIDSSNKMMTQSGALAKAMQDCTSEVLQTANRQLFRTKRASQIVEFDSGAVIHIDHESKTWTRNAALVNEKTSQESMQQLQAMGAKIDFQSEPLAKPRVIAGYEAKGLSTMITMSFQLPGMAQGMKSLARMEFWTSETAPGAKEIMEWSARNKGSAPLLRMMEQFMANLPGGAQLLKDGQKMTGQMLEMNMQMETIGLPDTLKVNMVMRADGFQTGPIADAEFAIPADYKELK